MYIPVRYELTHLKITSLTDKQVWKFSWNKMVCVQVGPYHSPCQKLSQNSFSALFKFYKEGSVWPSWETNKLKNVMNEAQRFWGGSVMQTGNVSNIIQLRKWIMLFHFQSGKAGCWSVGGFQWQNQLEICHSVSQLCCVSESIVLVCWSLYFQNTSPRASHLIPLLVEV